MERGKSTEAKVDESAHAEDPPREFEYLVRGQVLYRHGLPIAGHRVLAVHCNLRSEIELGHATTDGSGNYEIYYNVDDVRGRTPDLQTRVYDAKGKKVLGQSGVRFSAGPITKLRIQVDGGLEKVWSEYEQLMAEIAPALDGVDLADLAEPDAVLLAGKTAQPVERVAALVVAYKLAARTGVAPEVFYGFARENVSTNLSALLEAGPNARRSALESATRARIIPGRLADQLDDVEKQVSGALVQRSSDNKDLGLGAILSSVLPDEKARAQFLDRYSKHDGSAQQFWAKLRRTPSLAPKIGDLQAAIQLTALTGAHAPLVRELLNRRTKGNDLQQIGQLAALTQPDWEKLIRGLKPEAGEQQVPSAIPGRNATAQVRLYAQTLTRVIADTLPTEALAYVLTADKSKSADVRQFWTNVVTAIGAGKSDFQLGDLDVARQLRRSSDLLSGVKDSAAVEDHLQRTQRIFNLTTVPSEIDTLLAADLSSAQDIVRLGSSVFLQRFGKQLGSQRATLVYNKAEHISATIVSLTSRLDPQFNQSPMKVLGSPDLSQMPSLATLFGSYDTCSCGECRSVAGPAAYLAEVLAFLGDRTQASGTALDVLLARRPDLGELELTCENTDTVLPYVDLVNEVLERAVAPFTSFTLVQARAPELDARTVTDELRSAFAAAGQPLSAGHFAIVVTPDQHWLLTDHSVLYVIERQGTKLTVLSANYQTGASADQLAANPEHIWAPAYTVLREAVFPWALPLDEWREEVVNYLGQIDVARHELMEEFSTDDHWAALRSDDVAAEYLRFSAKRHQIVTGTLAGTALWDFYGLTQLANSIEVFDPANPATPKSVSLAWDATLMWVEQLLARAQVSYEELVSLLTTSFVNPGATARIVSADASDLATCELRKLELVDADGALLERLHRFVVAWRGLGWDLHELDRAIAVLGRDIASVDARLDGATLLGLSHVARLRSQLGLGVSEILAFWGPISTTDSEPDQKDSPYLTLFQNPAVLNPLDPDFALVGGEVAVAVNAPADAKLSTHTATLLAAFGVSAAELATLVAALVPDDRLDIETLSAIYRRVLLARGLNLEVDELLALVAITGLDPFSGVTADTVSFVELATLVAGSTLSVEELDYLLNHRQIDQVDWAPVEGDIATVLDELRAALRKVYDETAPRPDPKGDVTRSLLGQLRWPTDLVAGVADTLAGTVVYRAALASLPADTVIPADLSGRLAYDATTHELTITGPLTTAEHAELASASADAALATAAEELFTQPRVFVETHMRAYDYPTFSAPLAALPAAVTFPDSLGRRVYYDAAAAQLFAVGVLTDSDKAVLDGLSGVAAYRTAAQALYDAPSTYAPEPGNTLYATPGSAGELFDDAQTAAERFELVAGHVLAHLRATGSERAVVERIANALGITLRDAQQVLTSVVHADGSSTEWALSDFVAEPFAASNPGITLNAVGFPAVFNTYTRLVKAAHLAVALSLTPAQAAWCFTFGADVPVRAIPWLAGTDAGWLTADELPVAETPPTPQRFGAWRRLRDVAALDGQVPGRFDTVTAVMELARNPGVPPAQQRDAVLDEIAEQTGWDRVEVDALSTILGLTLPGDAADETALTRLAGCEQRMRRIGATAAQCTAFAAPEPAEADAEAARQLVKAKYPDATWADLARPLRNKLREGQRAALVAYLVQRPDAGNGEDWTDADGLYEYFLIDCQMSACALTSRLKQAMGSVQQFVQRCLLNLEPKVIANAATDAGWADWEWMKNYRVWQANREVFLFPENLLEPELRDDKSPLFNAAAGELLQNDVTAEVAEEVFLNYLEGLDAVARLEIAGTYLQAAADGRPEVLHVFGRTQGATTPQHYYRQRVDGQWTAWELVDLDIPAGQILPIIWNRRMFLFWPVFTDSAAAAYGEKPQPPTRSFQMQLAWSELRRGKWQTKRITPEAITSVVTPDDSLPDKGISKHALRAGIDVQGLKLWYELDDVAQPVWVTLPYPFVGAWIGGTWVSGWLFTGAEGRTEPLVRQISGIYQPAGTAIDGMAFLEVGSQPLNLPKVDASGEEVALTNTPGVFSLMCLHQDGYITGLHPFFYADDTRTYCVESIDDWQQIRNWRQPAFIDLATIDDFRRLYYEPVIVRDPEIIDPIGPIPRTGVVDPVPIARVIIGRAAGYRDSHQYLGIAGATPMPTLQAGVHDSTLDLSRGSTAFLPHAATKAPAAAKTVAPANRLVRRTDEKFIVAKGERSVISLADYLTDKRIDDPMVLVPFGKRVRHYVFKNHFHPYTTPLLKTLDAAGIDTLLQRNTQLQSAATFQARYTPTDVVYAGNPTTHDGYPVEDIDFSYSGAYSVYNWELFFHLPLLIASRLTQNQRFEEAQRWLQFIFDPTDTSDTSSPQRYWRTRPFYEESQADVQAQRIETIIDELAEGVLDSDLQGQIDVWRRDPFQPHAIARLRISAYQKNVVMRYLDNLIAWGDQLFRQDTIETINEATQLYVLAAEILGRRPSVMPPRAEPQVRTYNTLHPTTGDFSDAYVDIEYLFGGVRPDSVVDESSSPPLPLPRMLYFCVPGNDKLLGYWDTVEDRLFKLRHCMNIEGVVQQLPLFEPPIDPALLVRAAAAGVDIGTALSDAGAPLPIYRFAPLLAKAKEFAMEVKALGSALLGALESRDAEDLALLRATNEMALQQSIEGIRITQVKEAIQQVATQRKARDAAVARYLYYQKLLGVTTAQAPAEGAVVPDSTPSSTFSVVSDAGAKLIGQEKEELDDLATANQQQGEAGDSEHSASIANIFPSLNISVMPWGIGVGTSFGGPNIGAAYGASASQSRTKATESNNSATRAGKVAHYVLREQDWALQSNLAAREIAQIDAQIAGTLIRQEVAQKELDSHRKRIANEQAEYDLMTSKFTNDELRIWLIGRISEVYFGAYQLAYDVAKRAERAYSFELALSDSSFIQFGYWDSLRKGLMSGEQLTSDLHRMEASYFERNRREHELVKHVSLDLLHPEALIELRETGSCFVELPEAIFDLDHPGHYMRRIKSVSLSIPCIAGPYTSISATLTLLSNRVRANASLVPQYRWQGPDDTRFNYDAGGVDSIVTSNAREDSGLFSLNFNDERYLPFEGAGAISAWRLELPASFRQFDYETISDVILRVSYTARDGGSTLQSAAAADLAAALKQMELEPGTTGLMRLLSARVDYPDALAQMLNPAPAAAAQVLSVALGKERFPAHLRDRNLRVTTLGVYVQLRAPFTYDNSVPLVVSVKPPGKPAIDVTLTSSPSELGGLPAAVATLPGTGVAVGDDAGWTFTLTAIPAELGDEVEVDASTVTRLKVEAVADVGLLVAYTF